MNGNSNTSIIERIDRLDMGFTTISNEIIRNPELSLSEKGILLMILSCKQGFQFTEAWFVENSANSRTSIRTALKGLEDKGILIRENKRIGGRFVTAYTVIEEKALPRRVSNQYTVKTAAVYQIDTVRNNNNILLSATDKKEKEQALSIQNRITSDTEPTQKLIEDEHQSQVLNGDDNIHSPAEEGKPQASSKSKDNSKTVIIPSAGKETQDSSTICYLNEIESLLKQIPNMRGTKKPELIKSISKALRRRLTDGIKIEDIAAAAQRYHDWANKPGRELPIYRQYRLDTFIIDHLDKWLADDRAEGIRQSTQRKAEPVAYRDTIFGAMPITAEEANQNAWLNNTIFGGANHSAEQ